MLQKKHHLRAFFRAAALLSLVIGYSSYHAVTRSFNKDKGMSTNTYSNAATTATTEDASFDNIVTSPITTPRRQLSSSSSTTTVTTTTDGNRNDTTTTASSTTSSPAPAKTINRRTTSCDDTTKASNNYILTLYILGVIYMFLALAIVCDEFFVPALEEMSSERHLNLSMDVAGATLMAAGGSAPELFTSLVGTMNESAIGFGTIVGSAVFNVLFVIAMCSFFSTTVLNLTWWPLARDSVYYVVSLGVLGYFVGYATPGYVEWWESAILFGMYVGYVIVMAYNRQLYQLLTGKAYVDPEEGPASDGAALGGSNLEEQLTAADGDRPSPQRDALNNYTHGRWPGTFRAGIIKLLREPESWKATAGLGIVARIAGDVNVTFRHIDANCNGTIDKEELKLVFKDLGEELTPDELDAAFQHLDKNGDGKISEKEFTEYYIRSQTKLRAKVKEVFDTFDINHNGKIERSELITLLTILEPATTTKDIDRAMAQLNAGKTDNDVDITLDDFSEWYTSSILFEKKVAAVKSDMDGAFDHLKPPSGPDTTCVSYLVYVIYLPLLVTLTFTVPDVRKPGWGRWCYAAFLLSIVWIGVYSYFMVGWATIIGSTVGIPDVVMGLTFLAAGTSVPDLLSSVIVARRGEGDMAVSSSLGSNIFDILVGLPVPWLIYSALRSHSVTVGADGVALSIFILVVMVILVIATINFCGWKLSKTVGGIMVLLYLVFLAQAVIRELPFQTCTDE